MACAGVSANGPHPSNLRVAARFATFPKCGRLKMSANYRNMRCSAPGCFDSASLTLRSTWRGKEHGEKI